MDVMNMISGFSAAVNTYRAAVETLDEAKITTATNELVAQLAVLGAHVLAAQKQCGEATDRERTALARSRDLEEKVRKLKKRNRDFARYELVEPYPGTFVYAVKESARNGEPAHYLCAGCRDNRALKSIFQFNGSEKEFGRCPECKDFRQFLPASESFKPSRHDPYSGRI